MCDPVSAGVALGLASGGLAAYGQYSAGKNQQKFYNDLAGTQDKQAEVVEQTGREQERLIVDQAARDTTDLKRDARRVEGAQKVTLAANGVGGGSATAEDLARDLFNEEKADELAVRYNADMRVWETRTQTKFAAHDLRNQAWQHRVAGQNAMTAAKFNAMSSLAGGASQAAMAGKGR
jgi:hypothetical protein